MIAPNRSYEVFRKPLLFAALLLSLICCLHESLAQVGQAPTVVTLVPINVTEASATFRAEVNPNGLPTRVEFFYSGVSKGTVDAGSGITPKIVELRVSGLKAGWDIQAQSFNSAGSAQGLMVRFTGRSPDWGTPKDESTSGMIAPFPVTEIDEHSAVIQAEVNTMGFPSVVSATLLYPASENGYSGDYNIKIGEQRLARTEAPVRLKFLARGLYPGMKYRVMIVLYFQLTPLKGGGCVVHEPIFTTLGEPGHNPPEFPNVALRVPVGSTKSYTRLVNPFDIDGDTVSIESISQPQHGTATLEVMEWIYTPDSTYDGSDQFSVTVVDSKGERTTRIVQIYDVRPRAFEFDLPLNWNVSDPPRPAGRLKLSTTVAGAFTGKATVFGDDYTLRGSFDAFDEAVLELNRKGQPPLIATLKLVPGVDGEMHLSADIHVPELGSSYVAEGLPVGNAETSEGVGGLQYTAVLPLQDGVTQTSTLATRSTRAVEGVTPQGDGFLVGRVDRKGNARFTGRTGDGQTFTVGGRLQRNRKLQVSTVAGKQPRDYIVGELEFNRDETKSLLGTLGWLSYRSQSEYYAQDFTRVAEPKGAAYRKPKAGANPFGEVGGVSDLRLKLADESGTQVVDSSVLLDKAGKASLSGDYNLKLQFDRNSGLFRGTLSGGNISAKSSFMGALVQPLKRGQGHLLLNGPVGAVALEAPEN